MSSRAEGARLSQAAGAGTDTAAHAGGQREGWASGQAAGDPASTSSAAVDRSGSGGAAGREGTYQTAGPTEHGRGRPSGEGADGEGEVRRGRAGPGTGEAEGPDMLEDPAGAGAADDQGETGATGEGPSQAEVYLAALQRLKADFDNYRRRTNQEQARWGEAAVAAFIVQILPLIDNLERATSASGDPEAVRQGVELTLRQARDALTAAGVTALEAIGQPFDPERHEAVMRGPVAGMVEGMVAEEYRRGYLMHGAVLRPALVKVASGDVVDGPGTRGAATLRDQTTVGADAAEGSMAGDGPGLTEGER